VSVAIKSSISAYYYPLASILFVVFIFFVYYGWSRDYSPEKN